MIRALLEPIRDRSIVLLTLNYAVGQLLYRLGIRQHLSGATHSKHTVEEGVRYVRTVFDDYLAVASLQPNDVAGMRILEIGPGDNLGVALLFAAHGAERVTCLDRFDPARDEGKNRQIYRQLLDSLQPEARARGEAVLDSDGGIAPGTIEVLNDLPIEDAARRLAPQRYDVIASRAVLEHIFDVPRGWASMDKLLSPGGLSIHKIDFRNHGFYGSLHPLAFLRIPEGIWQLISSPDPTLNRCRTSVYERLAAASGYEYRLFVTHLVFEDAELATGSTLWPLEPGRIAHAAALDQLRQRLASPFRDASVEDLAVEGIFLVAHKAGRTDRI
jgi:SAM-dependent methyltransferase